VRVSPAQSGLVSRVQQVRVSQVRVSAAQAVRISPARAHWAGAEATELLKLVLQAQQAASEPRLVLVEQQGRERQGDFEVPLVPRWDSPSGRRELEPTLYFGERRELRASQ
jgi:hypothetical protein